MEGEQGEMSNGNNVGTGKGSGACTAFISM